MSEVCYVYLADKQMQKISSEDFENPVERRRWFLETRKCRWYTRGWTLQELIAPGNVKFYDQDWALLGTKENHVEALHRITKIERDVLEWAEDITSITIAERFSWASRRNTTRKEDMAYCLMGIMDVNMPLDRKSVV